jgi:hypothetical protein
MRLTTLNGVIWGQIFNCGKTVHYYATFMKYASDGLQELIFDTLKITNTVRLPLNDYFEAEIPADYVDFCKIGVQAGQFVRPLVQRDTYNNLPDLNQTTGDQENYPNESETEDGWTELFQWWGININSHGENTGAYYGLGAGSEPDTYKINEQRNVITCNQNVGTSTIVLEYISDGTYANSATRIPIYAKAAIEAYIDWKYKENSKSFGAYDAERAKALFTREHEKLRARKNDLTPELMHRIINRNRRASIKP